MGLNFFRNVFLSIFSFFILICGVYFYFKFKSKSIPNECSSIDLIRKEIEKLPKKGEKYKNLIKKIKIFEVKCKIPLEERGVDLDGWRVPYGFQYLTQHNRIEINTKLFHGLREQLYSTFYLLHSYTQLNNICYSLFGGSLISIYSSALMSWDG